MENYLANLSSGLDPETSCFENINEEFPAHHSHNYTHPTETCETSMNEHNNDTQPTVITNEENITTNETNNPRKSTRNRSRPHYLQDCHCSLIASTSLSNSSKSSKERYPLCNSISYEHLSLAHKHFSLSISSNVEPKTYNDVVKYICWKNAIKQELGALDHNKTWIVTTLPKDKRAIGCKWVFKLKYKADGSIERHTERLVAKSFTQTERVDYVQTFSPVVKMTTIRVILALASANK
ncbi:PREDICTED: uncharacterized protein LOC109361935 [Lupinus angustifolius]|uniref:uncharacterized protein LOC109361935 n=1 Tax=Lupinus angustifolius TaxID=3871 RepID=UPI00092E2DB2|nr:PREDICTED: uncharacterized protein LOC109361935 [Lupinus angustifolius]